MENHNQPSLSAESQLYYQQHHLQPDSTYPYDPSSQTTSYYTSSSYPQQQQQQHYSQAPQQQIQQPDYPSYYYPDYSNSYQSLPQADPISIHPPGVSVISADPRQTLVQNHQELYYAHGFVNPQHQQPPTEYLAPGHSAFAARGGRGGRPIRGGGRGGRHGSSRGRGRGRGGGRVAASSPGISKQILQPSSSGPGQATTRRAYCEICKSDCTTPEILEQHKNGKKHKRNLKVYEEMQGLNKVQVGMQNPHTQGPEIKLEAVQPEKKEGGSVVISEAVSGNNTGGVDTAETPADKPNSLGAQPLGERVHIGSARGGLKRKNKGGRGGKLMRCNDGSRKPVEPPKPKQMAILFCELCNVKCESQVVWDSHIAGKKHLSNAKRFPGHPAAVGIGLHTVGIGLQTLYPQTPNVPSTLPTTQSDQQQLPEVQALASTHVNQQGGLQDPQASQAAVVQLLNQHGIRDAQGLLTQLIPYLLTAVPNGAAAPGTLAQLGIPTSGAPGNVAEPVIQDQPDSSTQDAHMSSGENESKSETVVEETVLKTDTSEVVADKSNVESLETQG